MKVRELLPCLSVLLVRVNMTFDIGLHVGGGRTYGRSRDYQNFPHLLVTIFSYPLFSSARARAPLIRWYKMYTTHLKQALFEVGYVF